MGLILNLKKAVKKFTFFSLARLRPFVDTHSTHKSFFRKLSFLLSLRKRHFDLLYAASRGEGMREREIMMFIIGAPNRICFSKDNVVLRKLCNVSEGTGKKI